MLRKSAEAERVAGRALAMTLGIAGALVIAGLRARLHARHPHREPVCAS